jgi:hypothetical protein
MSMDKMEPERDFCEVLVKEIGEHDLEFAKQLQMELEPKDASLTVEVLTNLEENQSLFPGC